MTDVINKLQWLYATLNFWDWWVLAAVLFLGEAVIPSTVLLGLACGAGLTGLVVMVAPALAGYWQMVLWAALSAPAVLIWRWIRRAR